MYLNFDIGNVSKSFSDSRSSFDLFIIYTSSLVVDIGSRLILANSEFCDENKETVGHSKGKREPITYALKVNKCKEDEKSYIKISDDRNTKSGHLTISINLNQKRFFDFENSLTNSLSLDSIFLSTKDHDFIKTTSYLDHRISWDYDFIRGQIIDIDYYNFTFKYLEKKHDDKDNELELKSKSSIEFADSNISSSNNHSTETFNNLKLTSEFVEKNNKLLTYIFGLTCAIFLILLIK